MEIPKDGKTYLAWHIHDGMVLVRTVVTDSVWYHSSDDRYLLNEFTRWMDEKGVWHEVEDQ